MSLSLTAPAFARDSQTIENSLATVSALIALNRPEQLRSHLRRAPDNGVTKDKLLEAITHLAFYSEWPNAINAALVAKEVLQ